MRASLPPAADGVLPLLCELVVLTQLPSLLAADASAFSLVAAFFVPEPLSQSFSPLSQSFSPLSGESEALFSEVFRLLSSSPPLSSAREFLFSSALSFSLSFSFRGCRGRFSFSFFCAEIIAEVPVYGRSEAVVQSFPPSSTSCSLSSSPASAGMSLGLRDRRPSLKQKRW